MLIPKPDTLPKPDPNVVSLLLSMHSLVGGLLGALALGPIVDRYGAKRLLVLAVLAGAIEAWALHINGAAMSTRALLGVLAAAAPFYQLHFVVYLTISMSACKSLAAATQFAAMMAVSNLSGIIGDALVATSLVETPVEWFGIAATLRTIALPIAMCIPPDPAATAVPQQLL